jgi:hypothetical protein
MDKIRMSLPRVFVWVPTGLKESGAYALSHKVSKNLLITQISKFDPL